MQFLSIQAQDFIEENGILASIKCISTFLSIQAQDFIEERERDRGVTEIQIPEHSSSGLH